MKKLSLIIFLFTFGCSNNIQQNQNSQSSASTRIDNVQSGANKIFKDIDE